MKNRESCKFTERFSDVGELSDFEEPIKFLIESTPLKRDPDEINQSIIDKDLKRTLPEN